jgi:hypothetical protein
MGLPHFIFGWVTASVKIAGEGLGCGCGYSLCGATIDCLNWKIMGFGEFVNGLLFTLFDVFLCTRLNIKIYISLRKGYC